MMIRLRWAAPIAAIVLATGAAAAVADLGDTFTQPETPAPAPEATVIFADVPGVTGDADTKGFKGQIRVVALDYGLKSASSPCEGVHFRAPVSLATPQLDLLAAGDKAVPSIGFTMLAPSDGSLVTVFKLVLNDPRIKSVHTVLTGPLDARIHPAGPYDDVTVAPGVGKTITVSAPVQGKTTQITC